jgi:predicted AlkP superfamily pyrophosphatase or phosphodiesterase
MRPGRWLLSVFLLVAAGCAGSPPVTEPAAPAAQTLSGGSRGINAPEHRDKPHVILVSFDGFRWDYLDRFSPPNFRRVMERGLRAEALIPVFPSKTFPNHYSIVTGLYAENHGIVANRFYDPSRAETYAMGNPETVADGTWYRGEPIWVTAERQGMVAACFFWPGSEAAIDGIRPTLWRTYEHSTPNDLRVDTVVGWLRRPAGTRPHMITLYFSDVDGAAHQFAIATEQTRDAVMRVDHALGRLLAGIDSLPIRDNIYLVLVSDHGMVDTGGDRITLLTSLVDATGLVVPDPGPVANIHVSGGQEAARALRDRLNTRLPHGRAYLRAEVPERLHYRADPRVGDLVVIMDQPHMLEMPRHSNRRPRVFGMHGWDPAEPLMHGIFVASGPGIAPGTTIPRFSNTDIYPWLAQLLGLRPAERIDGRLRAELRIEN